MKREGFQLPAECFDCKDVYELDDDLIGEDWNKTIGEVLIEKYGSDTLLCPKCRKMARIIEEGSFRWVVREDSIGNAADLELVSKNGERKLLKVKELTGNQITLEIKEENREL